MDERVLVVGAGPVGLSMACELLRQGVGVRVVDAIPTPTDKSKALGIHARTLEVFATMGIADRFVDAGLKLHGTNAYADGKRIVHIDFHDVDSPFPFLLSIPQSDTERLLTARLAELGGRVERGAKLTALAQDDSGVTASLTHDDGREESVRAAWLVGCDGAHSAVRHALGLSFDGVAFDEPFVLADLRVDWELPADELHAFLAADGVIVAVPMPGIARWRIIADSPIEAPTLDDIARLMRERGAPEAKLSDPGWLTPFRIHRRIVPRYRVGRVFLAGDAAHIHSPMGGQGMNTGIQDAFNLGWKLALVEAGVARSTLLDSYDPERHPIAAATLAATDLATRVVTLRHPIAREVRNRLGSLLVGLEVVQKRILAQASEIGVGYRESPIVDEHRAPVARGMFAKRVGEHPTIGDWVDFGGAPHPGDRAPDVAIDDKTRLFSLFQHTKHTLLLFDGSAATAEGYANLSAIAQHARERWQKLMECYVIAPFTARPKELAGEERVLLDTEGALHRRYGAGSECLYLIRPDGYVGFRSQPASLDALEDYMATLLA